MTTIQGTRSALGPISGPNENDRIRTEDAPKAVASDLFGGETPTGVDEAAWSRFAQAGSGPAVGHAPTSAPQFPPGEKGGHDYAAWADPLKRSPKPEWVPPSSDAGLDVKTSFAEVSSNGSAAKVVQALDPKLVKDVAAHYGIDGRAIAVAIYEEARAYIPGEGDLKYGTVTDGAFTAPHGGFHNDRRGEAWIKDIKRTVRSPGYGTFHDRTMEALNPAWSSKQREIAQQYPEYAAPVIAQEMNAKAVLYEKISGISIRDNPAMLAWAYNTSMDSIRTSAEAQKQRILNGQTPDFNLGENRQLGSTPFNQVGRRLGLVKEPDGKGMGDSAQADVVKRLFLPFLPDQRPAPSRIQYQMNGIPYIPGAENMDPATSRG